MPSAKRKAVARQPGAGKKQVAAYARVSVDNEDTQKSLFMQIRYYTQLIRSNPKWSFVGVYADEGISGRHTEIRDAFRQMMADAEAGKIDLILVKSISRFARNTVDLLESVRHLKDIGVEVWFEEQNIYTFQAEGELLLTLMASVAQEESQNLSENIRWRFEQKKAKGELLSGQFPYGYRCFDQVITVIPEEAEFVRYMARRFLEGADTGTIAREINAMGARTRRGILWNHSSVWLLLQNEKIMGANLIQKNYSAGAFSRNRVNRGEVSQVYVENNHEPIISPEDFAAIQALMQRRRDLGIERVKHAACFTKRVRCSLCGDIFYHTRARIEGSGRWRCKNARTDGTGCQPFVIQDWQLKEQTARVLGPDFTDDDFFDAIEYILVVPPAQKGAPARLDYHFRDGRITPISFTPRHRSRKELWTTEESRRRTESRGESISQTKRQKEGDAPCQSEK